MSRLRRQDDAGNAAGRAARGELTLGLSGELDGLRRTFFLSQGLNRIGSRPGKGVVLASRGVSKRHALILVDSTGIWIEDLASKNGTFVNESRVESCQVHPGDVLGFGTLRLVLEALPPSRGLAIELEPAPSSPRDPLITDLETSPMYQASGQLSAGCPILEAFVRDLPSAPGGHLANALTSLAAALRAGGTAIIEWPGGTPTLAAASGRPPEGWVEAIDGLDRHDIDPDRLQTLVVNMEPPLLVARRPRSKGSGHLGLAIWGGPREDLARAFWSPALELVERFFPASQELQSPDNTLHIPQGYVRCTSPPMDHLFRQIAAVAKSDLPVLVLGETGVGKEGIARIVHISSPRKSLPFVALNCAAIPADLLEAELFGIGKGVATGVSERQGKFQSAEGGTLFLDEIGEMSADLQAKLLRALQEKEVTPVGGRPLPIDVRVVSATNTQLEQQLDDGSFRRDLYYRLAGCLARVPNLAERREDIPALVTAFLRQAVTEAGSSLRGLDREAMDKLIEHSWPGNVRQLEHTVRRLVFMATDAQVIDGSLVEAALGSELETMIVTPLPTLELEELERRAIVEAMERCGDNQTRAAELLGITRTALYRRLAKLGLSVDTTGSD